MHPPIVYSQHCHAHENNNNDIMKSGTLAYWRR